MLTGLFFQDSMNIDILADEGHSSGGPMLTANSVMQPVEIPIYRISDDTGFTNYRCPNCGNRVPKNSRDPSPASSSWSSTNSPLGVPFTPVHTPNVSTPLMGFTTPSGSGSSPEGVSLQFSFPGWTELALSLAILRP